MFFVGVKILTVVQSYQSKYFGFVEYENKVIVK